MIAWREKFRAVLLHFFVTLAMAVAAAALIFFVWYPDPFQDMLGGTRFFLLIAICDLVLGPLTSLIIYNSKKSRRALIFDYSVVGVVQLAAFVYGVMTISSARPVYIAFVKDRFEVVIAEDLADKDLQEAKDPYRTRPKWGPVLIGTQRPDTREARNALVFAAMEGKDIQNFPRYFVPYEAVADAVKQAGQPMEKLYKHHPEARQLIADENVKEPDAQLRWLPIQGTRSFWTVLLDANTGALLGYLPIDPYES
ncbi:MAG TPA: TfpX/TfpZ family type IV pilin accessory protein [Steroidobacter sp.]|uniref:TfpX/TfpZ family type IV pilin accessory protein n=1 Tax=Steroidobacter sp. TaxID=1978227 RepID=UPI002ED9FBA7